MKKLVLETEKLEVTIKGKPYVINYPDWGMVEELGIKGEDTTGEHAKTMLIKLGLPKEAVSSLQLNHVKLLFDELTDVKKN